MYRIIRFFILSLSDSPSLTYRDAITETVVVFAPSSIVGFITSFIFRLSFRFATQYNLLRTLDIYTQKKCEIETKELVILYGTCRRTNLSELNYFR